MAAGDWRHPSAGAYSNAHEIAWDLTGYSARVHLEAPKVVRRYGLLLETRIKANASGRPGPRVITGHYRRSWHTVFSQQGELATSQTGTSAPQARRLEYGFVGPDRLGRVYDQPPYPHVGPAVDRTEPEFLDAMRKVLEP